MKISDEAFYNIIMSCYNSEEFSCSPDTTVIESDYLRSIIRDVDADTDTDHYALGSEASFLRQKMVDVTDEMAPCSDDPDVMAVAASDLAFAIKLRLMTMTTRNQTQQFIASTYMDAVSKTDFSTLASSLLYSADRCYELSHGFSEDEAF